MEGKRFLSSSKKFINVVINIIINGWLTDKFRICHSDTGFYPH